MVERERQTSDPTMLSLQTPLLLLLTTLLLHPFTSSAQKSSSPPPPNPLQQQQQKQKQQPLLSPKNTTTTPSPWHRLNNPIIKHLPSSPHKSFTLTASPATDLWRPNSHSNNFSAPFVYRICSVENFSRISVTVVPGKEFKSQWDQGGIAILFPDADLWEKKRREEENLKKKKEKGKEGKKGWWRWKNDDEKAEKHAKYSWIKTGLEWENGGLQLSTVATYAFSDWSLSPVVPSSTSKGGVRFLVERNSSEFFSLSLIIYHSPLLSSHSPPNQ